MNTLTPKSREILHHLITQRFHELPDQPWHDQERKELLTAARQAGLKKTVEELELLAL